MKKAWLILIVLLTACINDDNRKVSISVSGKNTVKISGLSVNILNELQHDSSKNTWISFLPVYRMPADEELKDYQPEQPGTYKVSNATVYFTPDTAFVKGHIYFIRYYHYAEGGSLWDFIRKKNKPGNHPYTDLPFKL